MRKLIAALAALAAIVAAALPGTAQAHTGAVKCDATGVVFSYNPNFERDTQVTETVNGATRVVTVHRHQASTDTWAGVTGTAKASASWSHGGIEEATLICPKAPPPPPPVTPPVTPPVAPPPAPPVAPPAPPVTPPAPPAPPAAPVAPPAVPATPPAPPAKPKKHPRKPPKCPKGTTRNTYNQKTGVLICLRIVRDHSGVGGRVTHTPKHGPGGVTG